MQQDLTKLNAMLKVCEIHLLFILFFISELIFITDFHPSVFVAGTETSPGYAYCYKIQFHSYEIPL